MTVEFSFNGKKMTAGEGQSVAGALLACGQEELSRSSKYRRPRGVYCAHGHCPNCLVRVDGVPHVRSCLVPAGPGMRVETEGSAGKRFDVYRSLGVIGKFFPVGFQYRWFKRQNAAWRLWENQLRKLAAETEIPAPFDIPAGERLRADLLVVGAGPAGIAAAATAARSGLRVVLAGRRPRLGGSAAPAVASADLLQATEFVRSAENVTVVAPGTVVAGFGDQYVIDRGDRALEVTATASVLATGAYERAVAFPGNDRPGVLLTSGLHRLVCEDGVLTGARAVLVAEDDTAYRLAVDLQRAGLRIQAIVDSRPGPAVALPEGIEVLTGARVTGVRGRRRITGVAIGQRTIACDVVGMSGGWQRADELRYTVTSVGDAVVHGERATRIDPAGWENAPLPVLQGVGAVAGTMDADAAFTEGSLAGAWAAAQHTGGGNHG
ncbi:(2Fe-2S)-binding protein [Amycolatopsis jejuensis]|uniref:(2Fe-2S)-binding protein n=1 Tax=Amycolatopsis jejuensis TaxID=330084 RepID=UPI0005246FEA|nr:2Fe-2S iron-sulfur cluster-binding protein [Amycolatopsis jejuensis]